MIHSSNQKFGSFQIYIKFFWYFLNLKNKVSSRDFQTQREQKKVQYIKKFEILSFIVMV